MAGDWKHRLKARIEELGMTDKQVCEDADVSPAFLGNLWSGKTKQPGVENLAAVCRVVGWKLHNLFDDGPPEGLRLTVQHRILSNEMWADRGPDGPRELPLDFLSQDLVSLDIETNDYRSSGYRRGDVVVGARSFGQHIDNLVGQDCILETDLGQKLFKVLARGDVRGRYTLKSFDPAQEDVKDAKIKWAAPVQMILRGMG
jgi:transcriptional regulator with XRE-family HTH domain